MKLKDITDCYSGNIKLIKFVITNGVAETELCDIGYLEEVSKYSDIGYLNVIRMYVEDDNLVVIVGG